MTPRGLPAVPVPLLHHRSFFSGLAMPWEIAITSLTRALKLTDADRDALLEAFPAQGRRILARLISRAEAWGQSAAEQAATPPPPSPPRRRRWSSGRSRSGSDAAVERAAAESAAVSAFGERCGALAAALRGQKAKRERALSTTLCDLAAKNLLLPVQRLLLTVDASSVPPDYDGRCRRIILRTTRPHAPPF